MKEVGYSNTILKSHDETSLVIYEWSVPNPKAYIHLVHGMSEHAARYDHFAKWLNDKGYFVYSSDLRGHGKTAGDLSKVGFFAFDKGWDKVVSDLKLIHESYKHNSPTLSHIIMGHSMGSLLVRSLAIDHSKIGDGYIGIGLITVFQAVPDKFDMILSEDNPSYSDLPGVWVLLGGLWIAHFAYWGFNQYITQRALGAKSLPEAQKGVMFAAYLKLLMPLVIVLPGICAAVLFPVLEKTDQAYPTMMSLLPNGLLGLTFAALIAAIVSSLASMSNSISTIFTMDIYNYFKNENVSQFNLIQVGRMTVIISVLIATLVAQPLLGSFESIFQYIQNFTGYFSPGIVVIFLVALFWKKATSISVLIAALISLIASILISINFPELPFIHRMTIVFVLSALGCIVTTHLQGYKDQAKAIDLSAVNFSTSKAFNLNTIIIIYALVCIYVAFA